MNAFVFVILLFMSFAKAACGARPKFRRARVDLPVLCLIVHAHERKKSGHRDFLSCDLIIDQEHTVAFGLAINLPNALVRKNIEVLRRGEWFVNITGATVEESQAEGHGLVRTGVHVPAGATINTVSPAVGKLAMLSAKGMRTRARRASPIGSELLSTGIHTLMVVRVSLSDSSPTFSSSQLAQYYFDQDSFSVARQYKWCSFGAIQFQPYDPSNPVVDVVVSGSKANFTRDTLWPLAMAAGAALKNVEYLTDIAHHIAIVVPPGLADKGNWVSVGTVGSWWSLYNDIWGGYPNYAMHELGHNLGLGHAGVGDDQYADVSDVMGYDDWQQFGITKCFNGYHYWALNWFRTRSVSVMTSNLSPSSTMKPYKLAAFADFNVTRARQYVIIQVDSYYIIYNRAKGINAGVNDAINKVTIVQSQPGLFSSRVAELDSSSASNTFQVTNYTTDSKPLIIQVCSMLTNGALDYATISIGLGVSFCSKSSSNNNDKSELPKQIVATASPTTPPTAAPTTPTSSPSKTPLATPTTMPTPPARKRRPQTASTTRPSSVTTSEPVSLSSFVRRRRRA